MHGSRLTTLTEGSCGKGNTSALINLTHLVILPLCSSILCGTLTAASVNVKNALQIGNACMEAYENKLPQGFYNTISSYGVTMDTPMKWINMGAVRTVDSSAEHLALSVQKSLICIICSLTSWHKFRHHCY